MAIVITTQLTPIKLARSFSLAKEKNENRMFFFPRGSPVVSDICISDKVGVKGLYYYYYWT